MPTTKDTGMIDIKLRNVKIYHADGAIICIKHFMENYSDKRGIRHGVAYMFRHPGFYVYRTDKTVICVGQYAHTGD